MKYKTSMLMACAALLVAAAPVWAAAAEKQVATINAAQILNDSKAAKTALAKFQADFLPKEKELIALTAAIKDKTADLDKTGPSLSPSQLSAKQAELNELSRDLKRKQQQFVEDRDARKRDDIQRVFALATQAVRKLAESMQIDMVFQDVVYANPKTDVTAKVIEVMDAEPAK